MKHYRKGLVAMKKGKMEKARSYFQKTFHALLEGETTTREVYRIFANHGVVMWSLGDLRGIFFLEVSLRLNPKYDFARRQLERDQKMWSKKEKMNVDIARGMMHAAVRQKRLIKEYSLDDDVAYMYYQWLIPLKIRFDRHDIIESEIMNIEL
jgi:hypothetical protein